MLPRRSHAPGDPNQYDVLFIEEARWRQYNKDYECDKPSSMIEIHLTPKPNSKVHLVNSPASLDWCYALVMSSCDKCGSGGLDNDCLQWCYDMHGPCPQVTASNDRYSLDGCRWHLHNCPSCCHCLKADHCVASFFYRSFPPKYHAWLQQNTRTKTHIVSHFVTLCHTTRLECKLIQGGWGCVILIYCKS